MKFLSEARLIVLLAGLLLCIILFCGCATNYVWDGEQIGSIEDSVYYRDNPYLSFPIPALPDGEKCLIRTTESQDKSSGSIVLIFGNGQNKVGLHYSSLAVPMVKSLQQDRNFHHHQLQELEQRLSKDGSLKVIDRRDGFGLFLVTPPAEPSYYYSFYSFFTGEVLCNITLEHPENMFSGNDTEIAKYFHRRMLVFKEMIKFGSEAKK